ncbi:hypothetical protein ACP70R_030831 [Stipagrostis hirtigluma subsp. patula]
MALSRTPLRAADSPCPHCQGGSGNGARADVARNTKEVKRMLKNLEKEGVQIHGKIASIIDDEVDRIKAVVARENISEPKWMKLVDTVAYITIGFVVGAECWHQVVRAVLIKKILFG